MATTEGKSVILLFCAGAVDSVQPASCTAESQAAAYAAGRRCRDLRLEYNIATDDPYAVETMRRCLNGWGIYRPDWLYRRDPPAMIAEELLRAFSLGSDASPPPAVQDYARERHRTELRAALRTMQATTSPLSRGLLVVANRDLIAAILRGWRRSDPGLLNLTCGDLLLAECNSPTIGAIECIPARTLADQTANESEDRKE